LNAIDGSQQVVRVQLRPLAELMAEGMDAMGPGPTSLKVDIKGLEEEVWA
ncbi:MAG: hypothetical protein HRU17_11915, partial [Polyangiaceae bacterium]|nr:hypothetical protein [Polyangiaceae bacterium]